jgi:hypothetical protein
VKIDKDVGRESLSMNYPVLSNWEYNQVPCRPDSSEVHTGVSRISDRTRRGQAVYGLPVPFGGALALIAAGLMAAWKPVVASNE